MRFFFITAVFFFLSFPAYSQGRFFPGFVVLNSNDTLAGEIEHNDWSINPTTISFRNKELKKYNISDLKAFTITDRAQYTRFFVSYQLSAEDLEDATETFQGPEIKKDVWLKLLYKAKISLYKLETEKRQFFFVESEKEGIKELVCRVRVVNGELQKDEQYKNLLARYGIELNKAEAVQRELESSDYNEDDLVKIFNLLGSGNASYSIPQKKKPEIDIRGGIAISSFATSGEILNDGSGAYSVYAADFKSSVGFVGGAGFTFFSQKKEGRIQSRFGLNIASLFLNGENSTGTGAFQHEKYYGTLIVLGPEVSLQWILSNKKQPAIILGPYVGYNIVIVNNFSSTFENPGVSIVKDKFPPSDGGHVVAGLRFSMTSSRGVLSLQGYHCTNIFNSGKTSLTANGVALTYGIIFKRK
ncbi:MAG: hypothetical protein HZB42_11745 [Sphingobacteriales bacterium]|nr:hypothetical protein [Sphingobacteriales bacterium]